MRTRLAAALAAFGITAACVAVATPAQADVPCQITNFSPRSVVVGLSPIPRTFGVSASGCTLSGWSVLEATFGFFAYDGAPVDTFNPNVLSNRDAGARDVIVDADNADGAEQERVFAGGFSLRRRTTWQSGTFNAGPEPAKKGKPITITGRLLIADWDKMAYVPYAGHYVGLQFRTPTGTYQTVKALKTDANGWIRTTMTATTTGIWRVYFGGNSVAAGSLVLGDAVQVVR